VRERIEVDDGAVMPPPDLPLAAAVVWAEIAPPLIAAGMLKPVDAGAFAEFCVLSSHLRQLWPSGEAAPASQIGQWRLLAEAFGLLGAKSRVLGHKRAATPNPFDRNGLRKPPSGPAR
jgi:phage terminase small subunit